MREESGLIEAARHWPAGCHWWRRLPPVRMAARQSASRRSCRSRDECVCFVLFCVPLSLNATPERAMSSGGDPSSCAHAATAATKRARPEWLIGWLVVELVVFSVSCVSVSAVAMARQQTIQSGGSREMSCVSARTQKNKTFSFSFSLSPEMERGELEKNWVAPWSKSCLHQHRAIENGKTSDSEASTATTTTAPVKHKSQQLRARQVGSFVLCPSCSFACRRRISANTNHRAAGFCFHS